MKKMIEKQAQIQSQKFILGIKAEIQSQGKVVKET